MKKLFLSVALLFSITIFAQETYYGQIKIVSKSKGKSSTHVERVSLIIYEEYKLIALNTSQPSRLKIVDVVKNENTNTAIYKISTLDNPDIIATITANNEEAIYLNLKTNKKIVFDSRYSRTTTLN